MPSLVNTAGAKAGVDFDLGDLAEHAESAAGLLKALGNPHRLLVLCVLAEGELSVGALNERIPLSQSALSQHLAVLREDGVVETRREAQTIYYRLAPGPSLDLIRVLHAHFCAAPATRRRRDGRSRRPDRARQRRGAKPRS